MKFTKDPDWDMWLYPIDDTNYVNLYFNLTDAMITEGEMDATAIGGWVTPFNQIYCNYLIEKK